ncbi:MAG: hypothetical protein ACKOPQ_06460 [Novosphingobium sp.]|jgi:Tfp pilus assembly protein PilP
MSKSPFLTLRSAALCGAILVLSGCGSSRAGELEEKLARAEQAAIRAENAQKAAEKAAQKAIAFSGQSSGSSRPADPPSEAERDMEKASQDPNSPYYDNSIGKSDE